MKRNKTKKAQQKFSKNTAGHRRTKDKMKRQILSQLDSMGINSSGLKFRSSVDRGRARSNVNLSKTKTIKAEGVFSSSKSGFGFVSVEGRDRDVFIPGEHTLGAFDGDVVDILYHSYVNSAGEEKTEGRVTKIVEFGRKTVIGTVVERESWHRTRSRHGREYMLVPDDSKISQQIKITDLGGAVVGDKAEVLVHRGGEISGVVVRNFGIADSKNSNYEAILYQSGIEVEFKKEELCEAEFFAAMPLSDEGRVRRDREIIFTIDGEDAKDLDDAVSLRRLKNGWQLGVHIADVSWYVKERSHLDRAVMNRGTSVYFTDKVVPMLPKALSNGACSLSPNEDKYALSAVINLSEDGEIRSLKIEKSVIQSRLRGVYSEVNAIFSGTASDDILKKYKEVIPTLKKMRELYLLLEKKAKLRGSLELESKEAKIVLDQNGEPVDITVRDRGDAERLIEQFMLTANEAVATYLHERGIPCVYRVHENPPKDKLWDFLLYAHNMGFDTTKISREKSSAKDFQNVLEEAKERGIGIPVSSVMLRTMAKAKYSEAQHGHFGLGIEYYCHFTSPIRRLSDLATHRIIHKVLFEGKPKEMYLSYAKNAATAASEAELRALNAERRIENLYKVIYMEKYLGCEFDAVINSVTSFGFFAELDNTCEGLVPISELDGMYIFDEKNMSLRSSDKVYRIGDMVKIRVEEADRISGKLRFSVVK